MLCCAVDGLSKQYFSISLLILLVPVRLNVVIRLMFWNIHFFLGDVIDSCSFSTARKVVVYSDIFLHVIFDFCSSSNNKRLGLGV